MEKKTPTKKGRRHLKPSIALEKQLSKQIYNALQGAVVEAVLKKIQTSSADTYWRSSMEGHSLKVQEDLAQSQGAAGTVARLLCPVPGCEKETWI